MNKKIVIISGGELEEEFVLSILEKEENQYVIGVDKGMEFLYSHQILPNYIVGDFDSANPEIVSYYKEHTTVPIRKFNPVKDASDTEIAVRLALELKVKELWILGGTGTRIDHVLANIQVLKIPYDAGVEAYIVDVCNKISLIGKETCLKKEDAFGPYFSVFPLGGIVEHFSLEGARYPLCDHTLCPYDSLCVSNQIQDEEVRITFPKGLVILMETRDEKSVCFC